MSESQKNKVDLPRPFLTRVRLFFDLFLTFFRPFLTFFDLFSTFLDSSNPPRRGATVLTFFDFYSTFVWLFWCFRAVVYGWLFLTFFRLVFDFSIWLLFDFDFSSWLFWLFFKSRILALPYESFFNNLSTQAAQAAKPCPTVPKGWPPCARRTWCSCAVWPALTPWGSNHHLQLETLQPGAHGFLFKGRKP